MKNHPMFECDHEPSRGRPRIVGMQAEWFGFGDGKIERPLAKEAERLSRYVRENREHLSPKDDGSVWSGYLREHEPHMNVMEQGNEDHFRQLCSLLFRTPLTHGFAQSVWAFTVLRDHSHERPNMGALIFDKMYRLAEALGVINVLSSEHNSAFERDVADWPRALREIEAALGFDLTPPAVDGSLFGLRTERGILCERHFDSAYVAKRLKDLGARSVIEIGGGSGYVAHYARKLGTKRYTIIDLPTVCATQYTILAGSLGADTVGFGKEPIRLVPSHEARYVKWNVDCVVNIDSLPEMPREAGMGYVKLARSARQFLSINQESRIVIGENPQLVVGELCRRYKRLARFPSWMRTGWVEEVYRPA